jgi:hypothetical protein
VPFGALGSNHASPASPVDTKRRSPSGVASGRTSSTSLPASGDVAVEYCDQTPWSRAKTPASLVATQRIGDPSGAVVSVSDVTSFLAGAPGSSTRAQSLPVNRASPLRNPARSSSPPRAARASKSVSTIGAGRPELPGA